MCAPNPPATPDYVGAAQAEGQARLEAARASAKLNQPNVVSPFGSQTWEFGIGGDPDRAQLTVGLGEQGQQLYDLGTEAISPVRETVSTPFDVSKIAETGTRDAVTNAIYGRHSAFLDPQFEQAEAAERTRLANAGFSVGSEGFTKAMENFGRQKQLAYGDARSRAITEGADQSLQERKRLVEEALLQRSVPLNELNAIRTGAQFGVPGQPAGAGVNVQGAPVFDATQAQDQANIGRYNVQAAGANAQQNAATSLLGSYLMYLALA
jgi:hypothetical protein